MPSIPLEIVSGRAFVYGQISIGGRSYLPTLKFLIDTAAAHTFISPVHEVQLVTREPALRQLFQHNVKRVQTMLGYARAKVIPHQEGGLSLILPDIEDVGIAAPLDYLYFAEDKAPAKFWTRFTRRAYDVWDRAGQELTHSILGLDVLSEFSLAVVPSKSYGLLTSVSCQHLIEHLEKPEGLVGGVSAYYDRRAKIPENWID